MKSRALFFLLPSIMLVGAGCTSRTPLSRQPFPTTERVAPVPVHPAAQTPDIPTDAKRIPHPAGY